MRRWNPTRASGDSFGFSRLAGGKIRARRNLERGVLKRGRDSAIDVGAATHPRDHLDCGRHLGSNYARPRFDEVFVKQLFGHLAEIPDDPDGFEHLEKIVGDVDLPPEKP